MSFSKSALSGQQSSIAAIAEHFETVNNSLREYHSYSSPTFLLRFFSLEQADVTKALNVRLIEVDMQCTMALLAAVEAAFRTDYIVRCTERRKDGLSRKFRVFYRRNGGSVKLDEDIFESWKIHEPGAAPVIAKVRSIFRYRHWLAHGRYRVPKFGAKYDFSTAYQISFGALKQFGLPGI